MTVLRGAAVLSCTAALLTPAVSRAQSADDWKFQGSLYLYLPSIGGTTSLG